MEYPIIVVLWNDHTHVTSSPLNLNLEDLQSPTLSVGLLVQDKEDIIVLVSDIERYSDRDDMTYTIIYKNAILSTKQYGTIIVEGLKID